MLSDLKNKLKNRDKIFGTAITTAKWSGLIQMMKNDVLDFILLDLEHGRMSAETADEMFRMCNVLGIPVFARVTDKQYAYMSKVFDMGADGALFPRVETMEEARQIIESTRFPPKGKKGVGGFSLLRNVDGVESFNDTKILFLQIESPEGIDNLQNFLDLKEFEGVIVGPSDLSIAMGIPLQYDHPDLKKAILKVLETCQKNKMSCGIYCDNMQEVEEWRKAGMNILWASADIGFFKKAYDEMSDFIRNIE